MRFVLITILCLFAIAHSHFPKCKMNVEYQGYANRRLCLKELRREIRDVMDYCHQFGENRLDARPETICQMVDDECQCQTEYQCKGIEVELATRNCDLIFACNPLSNQTFGRYVDTNVKYTNDDDSISVFSQCPKGKVFSSSERNCCQCGDEKPLETECQSVECRKVHHGTYSWKTETMCFPEKVIGCDCVLGQNGKCVWDCD